jgi:hypothetical protein
MMDLDLGWRCVCWFAAGMSAWFDGGRVVLMEQRGLATTLDEGKVRWCLLLTFLW